MTLTEYWREHELRKGHIKPSTADVIEWVVLVAAPSAQFVHQGNVVWLGVAFIMARLLIWQWGLPTDLRWED